MAVIPITYITDTGDELTTPDDGTAATAAGDTIPFQKGLFLVVSNTNASPTTVTVQTPQLIQGLTVEEYTFTVTQDQTATTPILKAATFQDGSNDVTVTYTSDTDVKISACVHVQN